MTVVWRGRSLSPLVRASVRSARMPTRVSQTQDYRYAKELVDSRKPPWRVLVDATSWTSSLYESGVATFSQLTLDSDLQHKAPGLTLC